MTGRRTASLVVSSLGLALATWLPLAALAGGDLADQKDKQRQIQAETDRLVIRVQTMIRVREYNRRDTTAEKKLLDQVAGTLRGLSKEQMTRLIAALEAAQKAKGEAKTKELQEAQARHEAIVLGLKGILAKFDA